MNVAASTCRPLDDKAQDSTGFYGPNEHSVAGRRDGPPSSGWITDTLFAQTIDLWTRNYGRQIDEGEAMEILMNVKRLAEALLDARREEARR